MTGDAASYGYGSMQSRILNILADGKPRTDKDIARELGVDVELVRMSRRTLVAAGRVRAAGQRKPHSGVGRPATLWQEAAAYHQQHMDDPDEWGDAVEPLKPRGGVTPAQAEALAVEAEAGYNPAMLTARTPAQLLGVNLPPAQRNVTPADLLSKEAVAEARAEALANEEWTPERWEQLDNPHVTPPQPTERDAIYAILDLTSSFLADLSTAVGDLATARRRRAN